MSDTRCQGSDSRSVKQRCMQAGNEHNLGSITPGRRAQLSATSARHAPEFVCPQGYMFNLRVASVIPDINAVKRSVFDEDHCKSLLRDSRSSSAVFLPVCEPH